MKMAWFKNKISHIQGEHKVRPYKGFNVGANLVFAQMLNQAMKIIFLMVILFFTTLNSFAQDATPVPDIGMDEKLGSSVPLDLTFQDENGKTVTLKELMNNKPTVLSLVYYRCPGICSPLLSGLADALASTKLDPAKDYSVVTISFDPNETFETARSKKENYLHAYKLNFPESTWRFTTGNQENISKITDAVGFRYKEEDGQYIHPAGLIILSPQGKITRYLYGITFLPFDFEMGISEASQGRTGTTINRVLTFCYAYNPKGRKYVLDITKITGTVTLIIMGIFLFYLLRKIRNSPKKSTLSG